MCCLLVRSDGAQTQSPPSPSKAILQSDGQADRDYECHRQHAHLRLHGVGHAAADVAALEGTEQKRYSLERDVRGQRGCHGGESTPPDQKAVYQPGGDRDRQHEQESTRHRERRPAVDDEERCNHDQQTAERTHRDVDAAGEDDAELAEANEGEGRQQGQHRADIEGVQIAIVLGERIQAEGENHEQKDQARRVGALGETPETGADSTRPPDPPRRRRLVPFVDVGGDDRLRDLTVGHLASHHLQQLPHPMQIRVPGQHLGLAGGGDPLAQRVARKIELQLVEHFRAAGVGFDVLAGLNSGVGPARS